SPIADTISLSIKSGPLLSAFMSPSLPKTRSPGFGFLFLSYSISIYSFHLFRASSGSVSNLPVSSLIVVLLLLTFFLAESFLTFAYTKSDRPLASSSSSSLPIPPLFFSFLGFSSKFVVQLSVFLLSMYCVSTFPFPSFFLLLYHFLCILCFF